MRVEDVDTAAGPMRQELLEREGNRHVWYLLAAYVLLYAAVSYVTNEYVVSDELLAEEWKTSFGPDEMAPLIERQRKWMQLSYLLIPVAIGLKVLFAGICLAAGFALADRPIGFRHLVAAAVQGEAVFAVAAVLHLVYCLFAADFQSLAEYATFYPLSALSLVELDQTQLWMAYPLKTANLFEVGYVGVLVLSLKRHAAATVGNMLSLVACSYGAGLLLLACLVTFVSLYLT